MLPILGIIAGSGLLPVTIVDNYVAQGGKCYIAALEDETRLDLIKDIPYQSFKIGMVGAMIEYFQKLNIKNIIFAGGVKRPNLRSIKVDLVGSMLLARIVKQKFLGDDKILRMIIGFFEEKGFKVISTNEILPINLTNDSIITNLTPSELDMVDIELGVKILSDIGNFDIGQSVIVEDGYILGIEAAEGTDELIRRCAVLRKKISGGILVKMLKCNQDIRVDMPTIGPDTIINLVEYNYKGIALQKDKVIIIQQDLTLKLANEYGLFIIRQ